MPATPAELDRELLLAEREVKAGHELAALKKIQAARAIGAQLRPAAPRSRSTPFRARHYRPTRHAGVRRFPRRLGAR